MSDAAPLLIAGAVDLRADRLWPGDRIRRAGKTLRVERISVPGSGPVTVEALTLSGVALSFEAPAGELVQVVS